MPHEQEQKERKLEPEEILTLVKETVQRQEKIVCGNDVDLTISDGGTTGLDDPRKTEFLPKSGKALADLEKNGQLVGFISNRGGSDVARIAVAAGLQRPTIIGTFGFETFYVNAAAPTLGVSQIDERFEPYNDPVNLILQHMHAVTLDFAGQQFSKEHFENREIPTAYGPIILDVKGQSDLFHYGLAEGFNLNFVEPNARKALVTTMKEAYPSALKAAMHRHTLASMVLHKTWGMELDPWEPDKPGRYSIAFTPKIKQGKAYGMTHLLRGMRQSMSPQDRVGLVLFAGDDNPDAEAMRAASMAAKIHNRDPFDLPVQSLGVWVKPAVDKPAVHKQCDIIVDGPNGYAELLTEIAETVKRYG
jgi:hypothetical protein